MRLSKKVISLIFLSSMMLGFDSSSRSNIVYNSNLGSIKGVSETTDKTKQVIITQNSNKEDIKKLN